MLDNILIKNALALTGKTMDDMYIDSYKGHHKVVHTIGDKSLTLEDFDIVKPMFSIKNFCYYLLSPEFIEKYTVIYKEQLRLPKLSRYYKGGIVTAFGHAINKYQDGNEKHLIILLSKIGKSNI